MEQHFSAKNADEEARLFELAIALSLADSVGSAVGGEEQASSGEPVSAVPSQFKVWLFMIVLIG